MGAGPMRAVVRRCAVAVALSALGALLVPVATPAAAGAASLGADWPSFHGGPTLSGVAASSTLTTADAPSLGVAWQSGLYGAALDSPVEAYDPALGENLVYVGTEAGDVEALDASTGATVWSVWLGGPIRATPLVDGGSVFAATVNSPVVDRLDASTGAVDCSVALARQIEGSPVAATPPGGVPTIYIGTNDISTSPGPLYAIAESDCSIEWTFTATDQLTGSWVPASSAVDALGRPLVVIGTSDPDSTVYAVDALTGQRLWAHAMPNPAPGTYDVGAGAAISPPGANGLADGAVYVPSKLGVLDALDLTTGALLWSAEIPGYPGTADTGRSTPALAGRQVVLGTATGVEALDAVTGQLDWAFTDPTGTESLASPAVAGGLPDGVVVDVDLAGRVDVLSLATGRLLFTDGTPGYATASPAICGDRILVASSDGSLFELAPGGGTGPAPTSSIVSPADGSVVANPDGDLTATGGAQGAGGVGGVTVAVQSDGPDGTWWDAVGGSWVGGPVGNAAVPAAPGAPSTGWSFPFPVPPAGGTYRILALAHSTSGPAQVVAAESTVTVRPSAHEPVAFASPEFAPPGSSVTITGSGFGSGETVVVSVGGTPLATVAASAAGSIGPVPVKIPGDTPAGPTVLDMAGATTGDAAVAPLTVANNWDQTAFSAGGNAVEPDDPTFMELVHPAAGVFLSAAWQYQVGAAATAAPVVARDVAYVGDVSGRLTAVDLHHGEALWTWQDTDREPIVGAPAVDSGTGTIVVRDSGGALSALSTAGAVLWRTRVPNATGTSAPVVAGGLVLVASAGKLRAWVEATGKPSWSAALPGDAAGPPTVDTSSRSVVAATDEGVAALDLGNGRERWSWSDPAASGAAPAISGGEVLTGDTAGDVTALDLATGVPRWQAHLRGPVTAPPVRITNGVVGGSPEVLAAVAPGDLVALSDADGSVLFSTWAGLGIVGLSDADGVAFATTSGGSGGSGSIAALRTYTSLRLWSAGLSAPAVGNAAVVDGAVLAASADGTVSCFTPYGLMP